MTNRLERGTGSITNIGRRDIALDKWAKNKEAKRAEWDKDVVDFWIDDASASILKSEFGVHVNNGVMQMDKATSDWVLANQRKGERNGDTVVRLYREDKMATSNRP